MEKSRSCSIVNPGISSGSTSLNSTRTGKSSMCCSLLASMSHIFTTNSLYPFLMYFFSYEVDIFIIETFFGMPWIFTWFPWLYVHKIDLCKQSTMTWCFPNQSMPISISYDPKGRMFRFTLVGETFRITSQSLTICETFHFIPVANCTIQGLSWFSLPSLHT